MEKLFNIPTNEQLYYITSSITEILKDTKKDNITMTFELEKDLLRQVDEDYFYRNNPDVDKKEFKPAEIVVVNIGDFKFNFIEKK